MLLHNVVVAKVLQFKNPKKMINFCLTNDSFIVHVKIFNYINLYNGFKLGYEQDVEVHETQDVIILLCGIVWEQSIEQFESLQELKPNGEFMQSQQISILITIVIRPQDFIETFACYYYIEDSKVIVTNKLISFSK